MCESSVHSEYQYKAVSSVHECFLVAQTRSLIKSAL